MYDLYAIFKQAHPPSAIEHCLVCNFYSAVENNLVVAGTSLVRVYRLVEEKVFVEFHHNRLTSIPICIFQVATQNLLQFGVLFKPPTQFGNTKHGIIVSYLVA